MKTKNERVSAYLNEQWQLAQANTSRLSMCARHLFDFEQWADQPNLKWVVCMRCNGREALNKAVSYVKGYGAAGNPLIDVAHGLKPGQLVSEHCTCPHCDGKSSPGDVRGWNEIGCSICSTAGVVDRAVARAYLDRKGVRR